VPASDPHWLLFARLVLAVLVNAEEIGIDSGNVADIAKVARSDEVRGLLDLDGRFTAHLGLQPGWAQRMLRRGTQISRAALRGRSRMLTSPGHTGPVASSAGALRRLRRG